MTRNQARIIWKRAMKQTRKAGLPIKFIYWEKALKKSGHEREIDAVCRVLGTSSRKFFESRYMTVVVPKRWWQFWTSTKTWIITPQKIGDQGSPRPQVVTLAHELQHGYDFGGDVKEVASYLASREQRAYIEARGEAAGADLKHKLWQDESWSNVNTGAEIFDAHWQNVYRCSASQANTAAKNYDKLVAKHDSGRYATKAGADVARIVDEVMG